MTKGNLDTELLDGCSIVSLQGEHDLSTAGAVRDAIESARRRGKSLMVDLSAATFIDSVVLGVLVSEHERAAEDSVQMLVVLGDSRESPVHRLFELTRLDTVLAVVSSREDQRRSA